MSTDFVRYSPELDSISANFDQDLQDVLEGIDRHIHLSPATEPTGNPGGRAVRSVHAKGYGFAKGEVEILSGIAPEYAQGIYATPGRHDAIVRFSNGSPHLGMDSILPLAMGLGVKIFDIEGPTLLEDEPNSRTFDYANINLPVFFCSTVAQYLYVHQLNLEQPKYFAAGKPGRDRFYSDFITGKGTLTPDKYAWDDFVAFLRASRLMPVNLLLSSYWTMGAVRHGDYVAKVRFAPTPDSDKSVTRRLLPLPRPSQTDVFRSALVAELQAHPYEFEIQVQLSKNLELMPVNNVAVEWPEDPGPFMTLASPFVPVAKLRLPQQDISLYDEKLDALSFTPWRVTAEHAPLGEIQRARKHAYRRSSIIRHELNRQERREPRSLAEVLS